MRYVEELNFGRSVEKSSVTVDLDLNIISSDNNFYQMVNALIPSNLSGVLNPTEFAEKIKVATTVNKTAFIFPVTVRGNLKEMLVEAELVEDNPKKIYKINFFDPIIIASQFYDATEKIYIYENILSNFDMKYFYYDYKTERVILKDFDGLMYDFNMDEFINYLSNEKIIPRNDEKVIDFKSSILVGKESRRFNFQIGKKETLILCSPTVNVKNEMALMVGTILNKEEKNFVLDKNDSVDHLTNTLNKSAFNSYARNKIDLCKRPTTIMILDLDDFKEINDTYGHTFGDFTLQKVANVIKKVIYGKGNVGRFGGDEFLIVLDDIIEYSEVKIIASQIRMGIQWCVSAEKPGMAVGCSIGIARYPIDANNYNDLFKIADKSLYIGKMKGKNRYIIYDEEKHGKIDVKSEQDCVSSSRKRISFDRKYEVVKRCFSRDENWIEDVLNRTSNLIGLHTTISVYIGDEMECKHHCGEYKVVDGMYILEDEYLSKFENNERIIDNVVVLENQEKDLYKYFVDRDVKSCYQYLLHSSCGNIFGALSCDVYGDAHTFKSSEMDLLVIIAKSIEEYYIKKLGL